MIINNHAAVHAAWPDRALTISGAGADAEIRSENGSALPTQAEITAAEAAFAPAQALLDIAAAVRAADPTGAVADFAGKLAVAETLIDRAADVERRKLVPDGVTAAVYQVKAAEAEAHAAVVAASGTPAAADYPHLAAEVGITAVDLAGVAAAVLAKRDYYQLIASPAIEGARKQAKADAQAAAAAVDEAALRLAATADMTPPAPV